MFISQHGNFVVYYGYKHTYNNTVSMCHSLKFMLYFIYNINMSEVLINYSKNVLNFYTISTKLR